MVNQKMKTRFLIIFGIVSVMSIVVVGLSIASPSINNFDDFVYQLNEPFDGAEPEPIAQPESEPRISGKMAQEICSITGGECPPNYPANVMEDGSEMAIVTTWDAETKKEKQFVFVIKNKTLSYEEHVNGELVPKPEPEPVSIDHQNLIDARNKLREAYHANVSLGQFNIKDVIVGYGTGDGFLVVDILEKYYDSDDGNLIMQKIIDITGGDVDIEFNSTDAIIPTSIDSVFPYVWNGFLHRNGIEFTPKEQSYSNNDIGYRDIHRVCSPIIASNGTELYISSVFVYEPFEITGTYIDKIKPDDCYKIWKTDTILVEPTRELGMWLENYWEKEHEN